MASPVDLIANSFYEHAIKTIKQIYSSSSEKTELSVDELIEGFKTHYFPGHTMTIAEKAKPKEKTKRKTKELTEHEQCTVLKKNGERCKGKKSTIGPNLEMCSLHNNSLAEKEQIVADENKEPTVKCSHVFTRGANKDTTCDNLSQPDTAYCKTHAPKKVGQAKKTLANITIKSKEVVEEDLEEKIIKSPKKIPLSKRMLIKEEPEKQHEHEEEKEYDELFGEASEVEYEEEDNEDEDNEEQ